MGGKAKSSQRTKNNVRPSSSGRSAELLNNAVNLDPSIVPGGKMMTALFPTLATPVLDQGIPAEFSICIKKLNKKDPVTKVKALQELNELIGNSKVDDVVLVLPSWAHFYKILSVDTDCKVREMTQMCQGSFAQACGRRLAATLRRLVPSWLQAQYDEHAPAATFAQHALKATFPENKLPEVISFCKSEVMAHLLDSLIGNAQKTLIKPAEDAEERELQVQRLVTSSLQGLQYFVAHLPAEHHDWLWEQLQPLLHAPVFWKYATNASVQLRAAWFASVSRLTARFARALAAAHGARALRLLLAAAPAAHTAPHVWGCLLQFMHSVPDWYEYLDRKDLLVKRMLDLLEKGGWGDAKRLADMLLPLLAHLPPDTLTKEFYETFFDSLFKGLEKKSILMSKSERQYWIASVAECLRYLSIQRDDFVVEVTTAVHRNWIKFALSSEREGQLKTNLTKHSATSMATLVKFWLKQSTEANGEKYDQLVRNFWQNVCSTVLNQIEKPDCGDITQIVEGHILLLQTLKTAFLNDGKKVQNIKFDGDVPIETDTKIPSQEVDAVTAERYSHNLNEIVETICCNYFEYADKNDLSDAVLMPLITILNEFDSKKLYMVLAKHFAATSIHDFYDKVLMKWLMRDTMCSKTIVDIIFILLKHLTEEEQNAVISTFDKLNARAVEWCVGAALGHGAWALRGARAWLRGARARASLRGAAARALRRHCSSARTLLLMALSADAQGEMLIGEETASEIAELASDALCECLEASESGSESEFELEHVASVASYLVTALAVSARGAGYQRLVLNLFRLLLLVPRGDSRLSAGGWREARSSAHDGLCAAEPRARLHVAALLPARLAALVNEVDVPQIEHMTSLTPYLLSGCSSPDDVQGVVELTKQLLDFDLHPSVEISAVRHECVMARFNCPFDDDNDIIRAVVEDADSENPIELVKETFVPCINKVLFRASYIKTILHASTDEDDDKKEDDSWCNMLLNNEYFQMEFCKLLREFMVLRSLDEAYGFWLHHDIISEAKVKLEATIDDIIAATETTTRNNILTRLLELAAAEGYYWAYARRLYEVKVEGGKTVDKNPNENVPSPVNKNEEDKSDDTLNEDRPSDQDNLKDTESENLLDGDLDKNAQPISKSNIDEETILQNITGKGYYHCLQATCEWGGSDRQRMTSLFAGALRSVLAAFPEAVADESASEKAIAAALAHDLDLFVEIYHRLDPAMLGERDIAQMPWAHAVAESWVVGAARAALCWEAPQHHWDFATVTLCALLDNLARAARRTHHTKVAMIAHSALEMYSFVSDFISGIPRECERRLPSQHVAELPREWRHVFSPAVHRSLYELAAHLLECPPRVMTYNQSRVLLSLAAAIRRAACPPQSQPQLQLRALVGACARALAQPLHALLHELAHSVLAALAAPLADHDAEKLSSWSVEEPGGSSARPELAPDWFRPHLTHAMHLLDEILSPYTAGLECCSLPAGSEPAALALGALLLWAALHELAARARPAASHHYTHMYREARYVETMLPVALRLLPGALLAAALGNGPLPAHYRRMFHAAPRIHDEGGRWAGAVERAACRAVYVSVAGAGGGAARGWWGAAGRAGRSLGRLVAAYITQDLVDQQIATLDNFKHPDVEVRVARGAREAVAVLELEERRVELEVRFAEQHPLAPPAVRAPAARPAVPTAWIPVYIAYQNGTLANAIKMWSSALSSHVESSPQCYICYCRLHPSTGHLPNVPCHQCRNRFHTPCLHKWFVSSHRSNCPLCRSSF